MSKKSNSSTSQDVNAKGSKIKPRNPLSLNPLMKKSHAHKANNKTERSKDKQFLKKELLQRD